MDLGFPYQRVDRRLLVGTYFLSMLPFLAICCVWLFGMHQRHISNFWDARTYQIALERVHAGLDPYDPTHKVPPFVYPPIFLKCAIPLSRMFPGNLGFYFYLLFPSLGVLAIPWMLATTYIRSSWLTPAVAMILFTFQPRFIGEIALLTGNFGVLLHFLVLAAGIRGIRQNRWALFYLIVVLAGLVKPPFLAFLLLPVLTASGQIAPSLISIGTVIAGYGAQRLFLPELYHGFQNAVANQVIVREDAGLGIYSYLQKLGHVVTLLHGTVAAALHVLIICAFIAAFFLLRRVKSHPDVANLWIPAILVLAILANPRLEAYEATMAVVPAIYICVDSILAYRQRRSRTVVIAASIAVFAALLSRNGFAAICVLLLAAMLISLFRFRTALHSGQQSVTV